MAPSGFQSKVDITFIAFDKVGTEYDLGIITLKSLAGPALQIHDLPAIDVVLLSHEDHPDNLDTAGRSLLDARTVITTPDGANKLKPRPQSILFTPGKHFP
ncbi:hypothetical protein RhiLY_04833 [Ceratobasidium sp. AG-Ba]|nr:hypothetical protein RhiLY_04833 [Ceratobasidium sp. AG-Ba]